MREVIDQYGQSILSLIAGVIMIGVLVSAIESGGSLNAAVLNYMNSICG